MNENQVITNSKRKQSLADQGQFRCPAQCRLRDSRLCRQGAGGVPHPHPALPAPRTPLLSPGGCGGRTGALPEATCSSVWLLGSQASECRRERLLKGRRPVWKGLSCAAGKQWRMPGVRASQRRCCSSCTLRRTGTWPGRGNSVAEPAAGVQERGGRPRVSMPGAGSAGSLDIPSLLQARVWGCPQGPRLGDGASLSSLLTALRPKTCISEKEIARRWRC